jgi:hypothetical protein
METERDLLLKVLLGSAYVLKKKKLRCDVDIVSQQVLDYLRVGSSQRRGAGIGTGWTQSCHVELSDPETWNIS